MGLELVYILGVVVLGGALGWAIFANQSRNPRNRQIGDAATKEQYRHPETYDPEKYRRGLTPEK